MNPPSVHLSPKREATLVFVLSLLIIPTIYALSVMGYSGFLETHLYIVGTVLEFLFLGFFSLLIALIDHDPRDFYGLTLRGGSRSLTLGITLVLLRAAVRYAAGNAPFQLGLLAFTQSLAQPFPYNAVFAVFTAFTYGPLEVFYITFLVAKLDKGFKTGSEKVLTRGVLVGTFLWAVIHLNNAVFLGLIWAVEQVGSNFVYGVILMSISKYSNCSLGPVLSFTITNLAQ